MTTSHVEQRNPKRLKFYNKAEHKIGKQSLQNMCRVALNDLGFDGADGFSDDLAEKAVWISNPRGLVFSLGWGTSTAIKKS